MEQSMTGMAYKIRETAARIRELREITGITIEEMAARTGLSVGSLAVDTLPTPFTERVVFPPPILRFAVRQSPMLRRLWILPPRSVVRS